MAEDFSREQENSRNARQRTTEQEHLSETSSSHAASPQLHLGDLSPGNSLSERGRGIGSVRSSAMHSAQQTYGNRAVQRFVQRTASATQSEDDQALNRVPSSRAINKPVQRLGWDKGAEGPYGYLKQSQSGWGLDYGLGWSDTGADFFSFNGSAGLIGDDNHRRVGVKGGGGVGKFNFGTSGGDYGNGDIGAGTFGFDWSAGKDGFSVGGQANTAEGNYNHGKSDPNKKDDFLGHVGLSAGAGLGLRGYWGDDDQDGAHEYGLGFDLGPLSVDFKSEHGNTLAPDGDGTTGGTAVAALRNPALQNMQGSFDGIKEAGQDAMDWLTNW